MNTELKLEDSIIQDAEEALEIRDSIAELGVKVREIDSICDDLSHAISTIKRIGLKAYIYSMDREDSLADRFDITKYSKGLSPSAIDVIQKEHVDSAEEGLREYIARFVEMIKTLYSKLKDWIHNIWSYRDAYIKQIKDKEGSLPALESDTVLSGVMSKDDAFKLLEAVEDLHKEINSIPTNGTIKLSSNILNTLSKLGLEFESGSGGSFTVSNGEHTIQDMYPRLKETTVNDAAWMSSYPKTFVNRLISLGTQAEIKKFIDAAEKHVKSMTDTAIKADKSSAHDETAASLIRARGSTVRMLSKLSTVENDAVIYLCKTADALVMRAYVEAGKVKK